MRNRKQFFFISLLFALVAGFFLRAYNLDFPSIGYHNMKENENISTAQAMMKTGDLLSKKIYFFDVFSGVSNVRSDPQPPLVSYQIILAWKLLGENLWAPRLVNVLFGVAGILLVYAICRILFTDILSAVLAAYSIAIMPLAVFFSRNLQAESPAFFFMLAGNFLYLRFIVSRKKYNIFFGSIALVVAWFYGVNFFIGVLPFLFCIPYRSIRRKKKEFFAVAAAWIGPLLIVGVHYGWLLVTQQCVFTPEKLLVPFAPSYWQSYGETIIWYIKGENFTFIYSFLALCGIVLAFFRHARILNRYLIGWVFSAILYVMVFADELHQHNFSQMPFLTLVCIGATYAISFFAQEAQKKSKRALGGYLAIGIVVFSMPFAYRALERMYGTVFLGADVAGESLKEFTGPQERIFLLTHAQGNAIARYAQRYMGWPKNLEDFKQKEKQYSVRFVCIYPAQFVGSLHKNDPQFFEYIKDNYHVKELGILEVSNQVMYFILERGKDDARNVNNYMQSFSGAIRPRAIYKLKGKYIFFHTMRPQEGPPSLSTGVSQPPSGDAVQGKR